MRGVLPTRALPPFPHSPVPERTASAACRSHAWRAIAAFAIDWNQIGDANWKIVDGVVQADKGNGFLVSKNSYTDFQLRAEFWVDTAANSGIFIRCTNPEKVGTDSAYEVNIFDTRPDPSYGTGAIVNIAKVSPMPKAGEKWNTYEVTAKGPKMTVTLNGVRTVDGVEDTKFPSGRIALQYGAGVVKFRKVQVKPI